MTKVFKISSMCRCLWYEYTVIKTRTSWSCLTFPLPEVGQWWFKARKSKIIQYPASAIIDVHVHVIPQDLFTVNAMYLLSGFVTSFSCLKLMHLTCTFNYNCAHTLVLVGRSISDNLGWPGLYEIQRENLGPLVSELHVWTILLTVTIVFELGLW